MGISIKTRQAYSEIDEFIGLLTDEQIEKIPLKLRELFKKEKDPNYKKGINPSEPIKNQDLKEETLALIALLNLKYWCEDDREKERLKKVYSNNEKEYQKMLSEKYNPNEIFRKDEVDIVKSEEVSLTIVEKEKWYRRILNYFRSIFEK